MRRDIGAPSQTQSVVEFDDYSPRVAYLLLKRNHRLVNQFLNREVVFL